MNSKTQHVVNIIIWIIVFETVGAFLGLMTRDNIVTWYAYLNKSRLTPPAIIFSIVWPILYAFIAYIGYELWRARNFHLLLLYSLNIVLNWLWTPLFFQLHWIGFSLAWILALTFLTFIITIKLHQRRKPLSYIFLPYLLWLLFASYLNAVIWLTN